MGAFSAYLARVRGFSPNAKLLLARSLISPLAFGIWGVVFNIYLLTVEVDGERLFGVEFVFTMVAVDWLVHGLAAFPGGLFSDRFGRRTTFLFASTLAVAASLAKLLTLNPAALLVLSGLAGFGGAFHAVKIAASHPDRWPLLVLPAALFVRLALNALDGMLAREHGMKSPLGAILNELGDVASDAVLYLPLALVPGVAAGLVVAAVLLAVIAEMAGVVAVQIGAERRYDGPMGKSDRALAFGAVALALGLGIAPGIWLDVVLGVIVLLLCLTIWNRARRALGRIAR